MDGIEVKDTATLAKIKSVEEMIPVPAINQLDRSQPKIGEEQYNIIEECLKMDGTIEEACILAGISISSYYHHRNTNPDFARRVDIAKQFPKMIARAAVQRRIRQGDAKTALEFLKLRDKKRYNAAPGLNDEGEIENTAPVVQFISVPSDEGADQGKNDSQKSTNISSASDTSVSSSEPLTPRENEDEALRRLAS